MTDCVIFDLDGTLADCRHRLHHILNKPKDYQAFYDALVDDEPIESVRSILVTYAVSNLVASGNNLEPTEIIICTGRPTSHRPETERWLHQHDIPYDEMLMRPVGDYRPDYILKKEMLEYLRIIKYRPIFAIEDRPQVVKMWRDNGIKCLQVEYN